MNRGKNKLGKISIECKINQPIKHDLETMKITSLELTDVGGIPYLKLDSINPQMNIICGENGVGKTNILDSVAYIFSSISIGGIIVKKGSEHGVIKLNTPEGEYVANLHHKEPVVDWEGVSISKTPDQTKLLYLKTNRGIDYEKLSGIKPDKKAKDSIRLNLQGVGRDDLKNWIVIRKGFASENLTETQKKNAELVSRCFSEINKEYSFSSAKVDFEVYVKTPSSGGDEMHFELLSSGFKSVLFILIGIIKELDIRFKDIIPAEEYDGIILIDEIELHLHPQWQGEICTILKNIFPKAQFFLTTHSPHVVQTAGKNEVIALQRQNDQVVQRELPTSEYGYQGWTVEEILEDVMGMPDLRTKKYKEYEASFNKALEDNDKAAAQVAYDELDKMLHPGYPLRPVFRMQLDSLGE